MHSDVRPAEGDLPQSRSHFRAIVGGLAVGRRLDWFTERLCWEAFQHYQGATNLLMTELSWRNGPIRVLATDFVAMGDSPAPDGRRDRCRRASTSSGSGSINEGTEPRRALFGVYIQAEVNGGIGEPGLSWHDGDRTLLATNRGHGHVNRKLARDATVEFAIALDGRGDVHCEPTGPNEAILLRWLDLPAGEPVTVDLLVSGAFTGWRGDPGHVRALAPARPGLVPRAPTSTRSSSGPARSGTASSSRCRTRTSPSRTTPSACAARPWPPRFTPTPSGGRSPRASTAA